MIDELDNANEDSAPEPKWWIDEGVPGIGDRPAWMPEKFKTMKAVGESLSHLEKKLGTPPVDKYDFGEYAEKFDIEHDAFKDLTAFAKEKKVPQEVFTKMLESVSKYGESFLPDFAAEKAKLGDGADKRIEVLRNWATANLSKDAASVLEALTSENSDAQTIMALEEIRGRAMEQNTLIPGGSQNDAGTTESLADLQTELAQNFEKFQNDIAYQKQWRARAERVAKTSQYVDKVGF